MSESRDSSREKKQRNYYKYEPEGQQASDNVSSGTDTESLSMQGTPTTHRSRTRPNNVQNGSKNFMFIHVPVPSVILKDSRISEFSNQESIHYGMLEKLIQSDPTPTDTTINSQTITNVSRDKSSDGIQESKPQTEIVKENSVEGNLIKNDETEKLSKDNSIISTKNKKELLKSKTANNSPLQEYMSPKKEVEKPSTGEEKTEKDIKNEKTEKLNEVSDLSSKNKAEIVKSKNMNTKHTPLFEFMSSTLSATIIGSDTNLGRLLQSGESGTVVTRTLPMTSRGSGNIFVEYGEDKNKVRHRSLINSVRYSEPDEGAPRIRVSVIQKNPVNSIEANQKVCKRYSNSGKLRPISCAGVSLGRSVGTGTKSSNRYGPVDDCETELSNHHCTMDSSEKNAQEICMDIPKNSCNLRCCCCLSRPTCPQSNNTHFSITSSCQTTPESREISTDGYQRNEDVGSKNNNNSCCCCCCCSRCTNREKSTDGCQRNEDVGCKKNHNSCCCCCCSNRCTSHEISTDGNQKSEDVGCKTNSNSCCCSSRCPTPKSMVTVQTQTGSQTKLQSTNCERESGATWPCPPQNTTSCPVDPTKSNFCPNVAITRPSWGFNPEGRAPLMSYMQNNNPPQPFYSSMPPNFNTPVSLPSNNYPTQNYNNPIPPFYSGPSQNYNYPSPSSCVNPNQNIPGSPFYNGQMMNNPTPGFYGNSTQNNTNPGLLFNSSQRQSNVPFPALQNNPRKTSGSRVPANESSPRETRDPPATVSQNSSRNKNSTNNNKTDPAFQKQTSKRNTKPELRNDSIQSSSKDNINPVPFGEKTSGIASNVKVSQNESNRSISSSDTNLKPGDSESESLIKNSVNFEDAPEAIPSKVSSSSSQINADSLGSLKNSSSQNKKNSPVTFTRSRNRINDIPLRNWKESPGQQIEISPRSKPRSRSPPIIKNSPAQLNTNSQPEVDASQNPELTYNDIPSQFNSNPQPNYTNSMLYNNDPGMANYTNPMPYNNDQGQGNYMNLMQGNYMNPMQFSASPGQGNYMNPIPYNNNPGFSNYMNPMPYNNNPGFPNYMMPMTPGLVNVMMPQPQPSIGNPESSRHSNSEAGSSSTSGSRRDSRSTDSPPTEISSQTDTSTSTTRSNGGRRGSRARRQSNATDCSSPLILSLAEKLKKALEVKEQNDLVSLVDMITSIPSCPPPPPPPPPPPQCCTRNNCSLVPSCNPCETKAKPLRKFPRCPNPCPQCCRTPCCCNNNLFQVCTTCTKAPCSCPKPVACCPRPSKNVCCYQARSPSKCRNDLFKSVKLNSVPKACCGQKLYRNKKCPRKDKIVLMEVDECGNDVMYVEKR